MLADLVQLPPGEDVPIPAMLRSIPFIQGDADSAFIPGVFLCEMLIFKGSFRFFWVFLVEELNQKAPLNCAIHIHGGA